MGVVFLQSPFIEKVYGFLLKNPLSFLLVLSIWLGTMYFCERYYQRLTGHMIGGCLFVAVLMFCVIVLILD